MVYVARPPTRIPPCPSAGFPPAPPSPAILPQDFRADFAPSAFARCPNHLQRRQEGFVWGDGGSGRGHHRRRAAGAGPEAPGGRSSPSSWVKSQAIVRIRDFVAQNSSDRPAAQVASQSSRILDALSSVSNRHLVQDKIGRVIRRGKQLLSSCEGHPFWV